jgi:hypothetical protein
MTRTLRRGLSVMVVTALMPLAARGLVPLPLTVPPGVTPDLTLLLGTPGR